MSDQSKTTARPRPAISLAPGDIWCPVRKNEQHLARTVIAIDTLERGALIITYLVGEDAEVRTCLDTSFRQWVAKMQCHWRRDDELLIVLKECESNGR